MLSALGVAAGDRVAAMYLNTPAFVDLMFGAWRIGAAFVPVNHKLQAPEVARIDQDGYLFIVDRLKDMIVTGGENVYSKEVEDVLGAHPCIAEATVVGVPHPDWGETVVARVVLRAGAARDADARRAFCGERLAAYKIPREFVFAETLPRSPTGKLQKFLLRERRD